MVEIQDYHPPSKKYIDRKNPEEQRELPDDHFEALDQCKSSSNEKGFDSTSYDQLASRIQKCFLKPKKGLEHVSVLFSLFQEVSRTFSQLFEQAMSLRREILEGKKKVLSQKNIITRNVKEDVTESEFVFRLAINSLVSLCQYKSPKGDKIVEQVIRGFTMALGGTIKDFLLQVSEEISVFALENLQKINSCVLGSYLSTYEIDKLNRKEKIEEITKAHLESQGSKSIKEAAFFIYRYSLYNLLGDHKRDFIKQVIFMDGFNEAKTIVEEMSTWEGERDIKTFFLTEVVNNGRLMKEAAKLIESYKMDINYK